MSDCINCPDPSCACPLPECATTLRLGTITLLNTQVFVHIVKANGAEYIHSVTSTAGGFVDVDLTEPNKDFYNSYDGEYLIFVMSGGYFCEGGKLTVTSPGGAWTTASVTFRKSDGVVYPNIHIQIQA